MQSKERVTLRALLTLHNTLALRGKHTAMKRSVVTATINHTEKSLPKYVKETTYRINCWHFGYRIRIILLSIPEEVRIVTRLDPQ